MGLDLPDRHPSGVELQDLVIETCPAGVVLRNELWLKAAMPIPRDLDGQLTEFAFERLLALAVPGIATCINDGLILIVAQVVGHFGVQRLLHQQLRQLL